MSMAKRHGNVLSDAVLHAWGESGSRDMYVHEDTAPAPGPLAPWVLQASWMQCSRHQLIAAMKAPDAEIARPDGRTYLQIMILLVCLALCFGLMHSSVFIALYRLLYELVWAVVHAKLTRQDILTLLKNAKLVRI